MTSLLILALVLQLAPPTASIKRRHGQSVTVAWDYAPREDALLLYFSVKQTFDLNGPPVEFKRVPATERETSFVVLFNRQNPKSVFYVVSAIHDGTMGESFPSNTVAVERIGPPPQ